MRLLTGNWEAEEPDGGEGLYLRAPETGLGKATFESSQTLVDSLKEWLVGKSLDVVVGVVGELVELTRIPAVPLPAESVEEESLQLSLVQLIEKRSAGEGDMYTLAERALEGFATGNYVKWAEMVRLALQLKVGKPDLAVVQPKVFLSRSTRISTRS